MNSDILKGKWTQMKGTMRSKWGKLTDDDIDTIQGDAERFIGLLQERYGYAREKAEHELNDFLHSSSFGTTAGGQKPSSADRSKDDSLGDEKKRRVS